MCVRRSPVHCVVPPYVLDKIVRNGTDEQRAEATRTIKRTNLLRIRRDLARGRALRDRALVVPAMEAHSTALVRKIHDAGHTEVTPGRLVREEGDPPCGDVAADEAYDGAGATWELYSIEYGRNSIDGRGMIIVQTVHYGENYDNAFWDGEQMVYGDGDGELFDRFTADPDVIAHELSHGVIQYEANLRYWFQSGALNESFADVFGVLAKQRLLGQDARQADWLLGENVLVGRQYALRSMKAPGTAYVDHPVLGTDPQAATMRQYKEMPAWDDNGGVHVNSGIPNHAFYLAAMEVGGNAWEKVGLAWYRALCDHLDEDSDFAEAARATIRAARQEFGAGNLVEKAIAGAWKKVGVL